MLSVYQAKYREAEELLLKADATDSRVGNEVGRAAAYCGLGEVYRLQAMYSQAEASYTRWLDIYGSLTSGRGRATCYSQGHPRLK